MHKVIGLMLVVLLVSPSFGQVMVAGVAAWVDDEVITIADVEREARNRLASARREYSPEELEALRPKLNQEVREYLIDRKIRAHAVLSTLAEAQREGLEDFAMEKQNEFARMAGSRAVFRAQLLQMGITLEEHRKLIQESILFDEARRRASPRGKTPVSPAEMRAYYEDYPEEFREAPWVTLRQIVIRFAKHTEDEARTIVQAAQARLRAGEPFDTVARELSEGPNAEAGGLWEHVEKGAFTSELDKAAFEAAVGIPSNIIQTRVGLYIILVDERHPERTIPFDEAYVRIENVLRQKRAAARVGEWLRSLRKTAYVETAKVGDLSR